MTYSFHDVSESNSTSVFRCSIQLHWRFFGISIVLRKFRLYSQLSWRFLKDEKIVSARLMTAQSQLQTRVHQIFLEQSNIMLLWWMNQCHKPSLQGLSTRGLWPTIGPTLSFVPAIFIFLVKGVLYHPSQRELINVIDPNIVVFLIT
jgi:hypothetical protein